MLLSLHPMHIHLPHAVNQSVPGDKYVHARIPGADHALAQRRCRPALLTQMWLICCKTIVHIHVNACIPGDRIQKQRTGLTLQA